MRPFTFLSPLPLVAVVGGSAPARPAAITFQFQYVAKVVCSAEVTRSPLTPQTYATSININNPSDSLTVFLRKRPVITFPPGFQVPQRPLKPLNDSLPPSWALTTDCIDLRRRFGLTQPFFEGFVVIQSTMPLDVTSVFTVPGGIDVVPVGERRVAVTE